MFTKKFINNSDCNIFCTEVNNVLIKGNLIEGCHYFTGIPEYLYLKGLVSSTSYPTYESWKREYDKLKVNNNTSAYLLALEIYNVNQDKPITDYWLNTISKYFIDYTKQKLFYLSTTYDIWIVSNMPTVYLNPIKDYLSINKILGVEYNRIIPYGEGKISRIISNTNIKKIYGYIGHEWNNDGPLLSYIRINNKCHSDLLYVCYYNTSLVDKTNIYLYAIPFIYV